MSLKLGIKMLIWDASGILWWVVKVLNEIKLPIKERDCDISINENCKWSEHWNWNWNIVIPGK